MMKFDEMTDSGKRYDDPKVWIADSTASFIEMLVQTPEMPIRPVSPTSLKESVREALWEIVNHPLGDFPRSGIISLKSWLRDEIMAFLRDPDLWLTPGSKWSMKEWRWNLKPALEMLIQDMDMN